MRALPNQRKVRTFRSGPYLDRLLRQAEHMDANAQAQITARIQQARIEAGYTQEEMADLLGVRPRSYQNYESIRVPWRLLDKIADLTHKEVAWLLHGDPPDRPDPERLARLEVL
jgi:DNA-binding XRE family transcriptional regulator